MQPFPDESLLVGDLYEERWLRQPRQLCPEGQELLLLTLVVSAPGNAAARDAIRRGWATPALTAGKGRTTKKRRLALAFLVGASEDPRVQVRKADLFIIIFLLELTKGSTQQSLEEESSSHGDLLLSGMVDSYRNMTLKILAGLSWSQR